MGRGDWTDPQWQPLEPLLPAQKPRTGRPSQDHRTIINGILWVRRTGAPCRSATARGGRWPAGSTGGGGRASGPACWPSCHGRPTPRGSWSGPSTRGGRKKGVETKHWAAPAAAGARRSISGPRASAFVLTPGQPHEATVFEAWMTRGAVKRPGVGRPRLRPERVCGDQGYRSRQIRAGLRRRGIRYTIPRKKNERCQGPFDRAVYRSRNRGGAGHPPSEAIPPHRYPLRKAGGELPGHAAHRLDLALVAVCKYALGFLHTECPFCVLDAPLWRELSHKTTVVGVSREPDRAKLTDFALENDLDFPILMDPDGVLAKRLGVLGTPMKYAILPDLRVVQTWFGMTSRQSPPSELGGLLSLYEIEPTSLPADTGREGRVFASSSWR